MAIELPMDLAALEGKVGYTFKNRHRLITALTHSSYANEQRGECLYNERQEFLGDAVLSIIVSEYLYKNYSLPEGELTKLRAAIVCEKSLHGWALELGLGEYMLLGKGEELTGGRARPSILADAFEALIAAVFLDGGLGKARAFVLPYAQRALAEQQGPVFKDYKTILQEIIQKNPEEKLRYILAGSEGPDHDKRFVVEVHLNSNVIGCGRGRSKKEAEQLAAREALVLMGQVGEAH